MAMCVWILFYVIISNIQLSLQSENTDNKSLQYHIKTLETMFHEEIAELKSGQLRCGTDIEILHKQIQALENIVNDVQSENDFLKSKVRSLETLHGITKQNLPQRAESKIFKSYLNDTDNVSQLKYDVNSNRIKNNKRENGQRNQKDTKFVRSLRLSRTPRGTPIVTDIPAFSAVLTRDLDHQHLAIGLTIVYDKVYLNIGSSFDPTTGVFTCLQDGVYVFHNSLECNDHNYLNANFIKNGEAFGRTIASGNDFHGFGSNMAITQLVTGDRVWIQISGFHTSAVATGHQYFAGFLKKP